MEFHLDTIQLSEEEYEAELKAPWSKNDDFKFEFLNMLIDIKNWSSDEKMEVSALLGNSDQKDDELRNKIKRKYLADKVLCDSKLLKADKEEIYYLLTGERPLVRKKGSPSKILRDTLMALEYVYRSYKGNKKHVIKNMIKSKYQISEENTFYIALNKGKKNIKKIYIEYLKKYDEQTESGMDAAVSANYQTISSNNTVFESNEYLLRSDRFIYDCICRMFDQNIILKMVDSVTD